jgi:iron(III) transport system substrate-binding protein
MDKTADTTDWGSQPDRNNRTTVRRRARRRRSALRWTPVVALSALALAPGATAAASHSSSDKHVVPLVFYSSIGFDQLAATDFTKRFHIPVEVEHNPTGAALDQIEASRNDPKWDFWWTDGPTNFALLDSQHMLVRGFEPKVDWNDLGREAVPRDGSYVPTGITIAAALVYNRQRVAHPPTSWAQLLSPAWKDKVGMNDPSISGPTYPFVAGMMQQLGGISAGESYFEALKANGLLVEPKNGPTLAALASGEIDVALVQSTAAVGATFSDHELGVEYLSPSTLLPSAIGIDAKAPALARSEAETFIEYMLSPAGQKIMETGDPTGDSLYYPVLRGIRARPVLPPLTSVETITINPYTWGAREGAIDTWFTQHIVQ